MFWPSTFDVEKTKKEYPKGTVVELVKMNDVQAPPVGTRGVVGCVDDTGTIHVNWNGYGRLGVAYGDDECKKIMDIRIHKTWQGYEIERVNPTNPKFHQWVSKVYNGEYTWVDDYLYAKKFSEQAARKHKEILERM